jgi:hypothetical protein
MSPRSDSIAQLAAALAKAQIELVNPTKTLTGVIDRWGSGGEGQSYRYAPLSAGLEIVRKTLCKHELAVIQTTHVDWDVEMVMLTTTLAHGSGEFMSASWPVCRTADMSNPKLMGAALTYARRYGLFTLVGIAGEDDLDAPELDQGILGNRTLRPRHQQQTAAPFRTGMTSRGEAEPHLSSDDLNRPRSAWACVRAGPKEAARRRCPRGPVRPANSVEHAIDRLSACRDLGCPVPLGARCPAIRNELTDTSRATLDAAFFEKADELGVDPGHLAGSGQPPSRIPPHSFHPDL